MTKRVKQSLMAKISKCQMNDTTQRRADQYERLAIALNQRHRLEGQQLTNVDSGTVDMELNAEIVKVNNEIADLKTQLGITDACRA